MKLKHVAIIVISIIVLGATLFLTWINMLYEAGAPEIVEREEIKIGNRVFQQTVFQSSMTTELTLVLSNEGKTVWSKERYDTIVSYSTLGDTAYLVLGHDFSESEMYTDTFDVLITENRLIDLRYRGNPMPYTTFNYDSLQQSQQ